ncbi:MAG: hypothetical protein LBL52_04260 [Rickettsiales bacterium]|jgi:hypothetical protein|nr:hypothetical protein [Rickettsiales bacterium]
MKKFIMLLAAIFALSVVAPASVWAQEADEEIADAVEDAEEEMDEDSMVAEAAADDVDDEEDGDDEE